MLLVIALWASAAWLAFGALSSVALINKEREPLTAGTAIIVLISSGLIITALITAAIHLA